MTNLQNWQRGFCWVAILATLVLAAFPAHAEDSADAVCARFREGAKVANPDDLYSSRGVLEVRLHFKQALDAQGITRFCYVTDAGVEAPTLHVRPGDKLILHLKNDLALENNSAPAHDHAANTSGDCRGGAMAATSTNLHFHGTTLAPTCHQDDVLTTLVSPNQGFDYVLQIPKNEAPGLYWYHPHPHGFTELQVQGGASGVLIVDGIERVYPELAGLPQRVLTIRDQQLTEIQQRDGKNDANKPSWDLSLNYVPVHYPKYVPAVIETRPKQRELWRVLNAAADALLDLQVQVKGVPQPLQVFAIDGVPFPKSNGPATQTTLAVAPGARVEFVVTTPEVGDEAQLVTLKHDTGPAGDSDPARPIANIVSNANAALPAPLKSEKGGAAPAMSFAGLSDAKPVFERHLVFAEENSKDDAQTIFFIATVPGVHEIFHFQDPPKFKVRQGTVEDWRIENLAKEDHTFHIHQLHFQVLAINGQPANDPALRDTITLPYWTGKGPYPSVTLRMDFRDPNIIGTFPFHCHILAHEDAGMMAKLQVLPPAVPTQLSLQIAPQAATVGVAVTITARLAGLREGQSPEGYIGITVDGGGHPIFTIENGVATYTTTFKAAGKHTISANYIGDDVYGPSAAAEVIVEAAKK